MVKRFRKSSSSSSSESDSSNSEIENSLTLNSANCESDDTDYYATDKDSRGNLKGFIDYSNNLEIDSDYSDIEKTITNEIPDMKNKNDETDETEDTINKLSEMSISPINKSFEELFNDYKKFVFSHMAGGYKNSKGEKCKMNVEFKRINIYQNVKGKVDNDGLYYFTEEASPNKNVYYYYSKVDSGKIPGSEKGYTGNLFVKSDENKTFLKLMSYVRFHPEFTFDICKSFFNFVPRLPPVCDLILDCDIEYFNEIDTTEGRIYKKLMDVFIDIYCNICKNHFYLDKNKTDEKGFPYYVIEEKPKPTYKSNEKMYKDGFHMRILQPFDYKHTKFIQSEGVKQLKETNEFKELINNNKLKHYEINKIIDDCTERHQNIMVYGNVKLNTGGENEYSPCYEITNSNIDNFNEKNAIIMLNAYKYMENNIEPLKLKKEFDIDIMLCQETSKKQKLDEIDLDLLTPTNKSITTNNNKILNSNNNKISNSNSIEIKDEINEVFEYEHLKKMVEAIEKVKDDEDKKKLILKYFQDEKEWVLLCCALLCKLKNHPELTTQIWSLITRLSMLDPKYDTYDTERNKQIILSTYKEKENTVSVNHLKDIAKLFNEEEVNKIVSDAYKRNFQIKQIKYNDIEIVKTDKYKLNFNKNEEFNPYKFDKLFENNIIDAIKYFYQYYIYVGNDTFYKLYSKVEYERKIYDFQEIKGNKFLDLNLKKDLSSNEKKLIDYCLDFGYHRIKNAIKEEKKGKFTISFYNALDTTKSFFSSTLINDITEDLYFGQKGLNQFNIQVSNNLFFNENNLKRCLYFDDILNTNVIINEDNNYLQVFKYYIDNYIIKRNADDNDINLIEQKRFYIYNYLKTIFNFKKNHSCLILLGGQGTLKSTLGKMIISCISNKIGRSLTGSEFLNETYSGSILEDALFVQLEELKVSETGAQHNDMINNLKNIITADEIRIRKILKNPEFKKTFISYLITSNFNCPLKITFDDRRYVVFEINNKCEDDKFITELNNLFTNKDALISLYNYFKNTNFTCHCNDPNCLYHKLNEKDAKPFEYIEGIITPEKRRIIQGTSNVYEQFLVDFYYQIKFDYANKKLLNLKNYIVYDDNDINNSKFNITISKFYGEFTKFFESKMNFNKKKVPNKQTFKECINFFINSGIFKYISNRYTHVLNSSLSEYRNALFKFHLIDTIDDYIFIDDDGNFINESNFKPFSISDFEY